LQQDFFYNPDALKAEVFVLIPCVSRNVPHSIPVYFSNNSVKNLLIIIIFGIRHPVKPDTKNGLLNSIISFDSNFD